MKTSVLGGTLRLIGAMMVAVLFLFVSGCASTQDQVDAATVMSAQEVDAEMVKWYRKAAERGVASAQFLLGMSYADGKGVAEDDAEAVRWYRKAAEQGLAEAQFNLGTAYASGEGIAEDDARAVKWYRKAAEQGDAMAQHNLALMCQ